MNTQLPVTDLRHTNHLIHLKVKVLDKIFDALDPEPIAFRKLDPDWVDYLIDEMNDRTGSKPVNLSLEIPSATLVGTSPLEVEESIRREFHEHVRMLERRLKEVLRIGRISLAFALCVLIIFTLLSIASERLYLGIFQRFFSEGFVIIGWVALWRPVEALLYDWWPIIDERKKIRRLIAGKISVKSI
ncbi:MAG: hypothetical protein JWM20_790 [Patescibacteria group bacterium]|nr:hypothetical protein [Patescibacteria group bacterium]